MSERKDQIETQSGWPLAKDEPVDHPSTGAVVRAFIVAGIVGAISAFFLALIAVSLPSMFTGPGPQSQVIRALAPLVVLAVTLCGFVTGGIYGIVRSLRKRR